MSNPRIQVNYTDANGAKATHFCTTMREVRVFIYWSTKAGCSNYQIYTVNRLTLTFPGQ